ncbi:MAG TPA: trypsin-like peptidase domain-containing protein [Candidatus Paceibacterota bacterium]|nr:trypsin-like peptidase domain-containing protein [Candidatus Paceibacterota bacterium]
MEDLNNHQMVLLCVLVSFVTAIATGIITVALLQESPQTVTQTVNRVVERTIERVVPEEIKPEKPAVTTVTKEVTVYAKEDDLIIGAVEKNQPRIARIFAGASTSSDPIGIGFVVAQDGTIVTSASVTSGHTAFSVMIGSKTYAAKQMSTKDVSAPASLLRVVDLAKGEKIDAVAIPTKLELKLAQSAIVLGGEDGSSVFKTTLAKFAYAKTESTTTPPLLIAVETNPRIPERNSGALVSNLDGQAIGVSVWDESLSRYVIYPMARILDLLSAAAEADAAAKPQGQGGESPSEKPAGTS